MYYDTKESGERIRQLRLKYGYTQEKTAVMLNIDRSFFSRIESGKKGCSIDLLVQISVLFHSSLDYLVLGNPFGKPMDTANRTQIENDIAKLIEHLEQFKDSL